MKDIKILVFDCDGVMFDTKEANKAYYNTLLIHFNLPIMTSDEVEYAHMHSVDDSIAFLFHNKIDLDRVHQYRKQMDYFPFLSKMEIEPHLKKLIKKARPRYKTSVASNRTDTMDAVIKEHGLTIYFDLIVCAQDVDRPKPHPDMLFKTMEHFNVLSNQLIYVGDSKLDEMAAKASNIPLIAYKNKDLQADYHIESLREIESILGL